MINSLEIVSCRFHYSVVIFICVCIFVARANPLPYIVCINCVWQADSLFIFFLSRWISMRWTNFFPANICIKLSLRVTFTLHISGSIDSTLFRRIMHIMTTVQIDSMTESSVKLCAPSIICPTNICLVSVWAHCAHATLQALTTVTLLMEREFGEWQWSQQLNRFSLASFNVSQQQRSRV